ncbi:MAG: response regulator [Nodosilinea sp.]|jgi:diguanylate cyclase (GGDEF)-like protein
MKILLVEDDQSTRELLAFHLGLARYTVEQAEDGATALDLAVLWNYDLIMLDVNIPYLDGVSLCRQLRVQGVTTPILMLTAQAEDRDVINGLDAGADDYVTKPFEVSRVLARVRALLRRGRTAATIPSLVWGDLCLDPVQAQVSYQGQVVPLTPKEYSLLELFLRYPKRVFSRSTILDHLWTIDDSPTEGAVTNLVKDLRNRLKRAGIGENVVQTVYGLGYRLRECPQGTAKSALSPQGSEQLEQITVRFQASLPQRLRVIEDGVRALQAGAISDQQRLVIQEEAHRLAGGLGTFGQAEASAQAGEMEQVLLLDQPLGEAEVMRLSHCLLALKQSLAHLDPAPAPPTSGDYRIQTLGLGPDLVADLQRSADPRGWHLEATTDGASLGQGPGPTAMDGVLVALDQTLPLVDRLAPLRQLKATHPSLPVVVLALQDSLEERVQVARLQVDCCLAPDLTAHQILTALEGVLAGGDRPEARVMVVDSDALDRAAIAELLTPWGLRVIELDDPQQFWQVLRQSHPDLLILAMDMPTFSGLELCQVVRQDSQYGNLPVLIATPHPNQVAVRQIFEVGGDDLIAKPVVGPELVTRVLSRIERSHLRQQVDHMRQQQAMVWGQPWEDDSLNPVGQRDHFDRVLQRQWERQHRDQSPLGLILCAIDQLPPYQEIYGQQAADAVVYRMAQTLQRSINPNQDLVARYDRNQFALLLPDTNLDGALRVATRVQRGIAQLAMAHNLDLNLPSPHFTLSLGIGGTTPRPGLTPTQLIDTTQEALGEAQERGGNTFCLYPL